MNVTLGPGVASPCVNVCRMDEASGRCLGCLRTLDEIAHWSVMDDTARRDVWAQLHERRSGLCEPTPPARPGGRS